MQFSMYLFDIVRNQFLLKYLKISTPKFFQFVSEFLLHLKAFLLNQNRAIVLLGMLNDDASKKSARKKLIT